MSNLVKMYEYFKLNKDNKLYGFIVHEMIAWEHQLAVYFKKDNMITTVFIKEETVRVESKLFGGGQMHSVLLDQTIEYDGLDNLGDIIIDVLDYDGLIYHSVAEMKLDWKEDKVMGFMR